jgi:hypothetical protein
MAVEFLPLHARDHRKPFHDKERRYYFFMRRGRLLTCENGERVLAVPCHWCGWWFFWRVLTVDHVTPRAMGGHARQVGNLVPACRACNGGRADEFLRHPDGQEWLRLEALRREVKGIFMRAAFAAAKHVVQGRSGA